MGCIGIKKGKSRDCPGLRHSYPNKGASNGKEHGNRNERGDNVMISGVGASENWRPRFGSPFSGLQCTRVYIGACYLRETAISCEWCVVLVGSENMLFGLCLTETKLCIYAHCRCQYCSLFS